MFQRLIERWHWSVLAGLAMPLFVGCGRTSLPGASDASVARASLQTMLEAWQRGDPAEQLRNSTPAIVAIDDDWRSGLRLTRYELKDQGVQHGVNIQSSVMLSLEDASGKKLEREAVYIIGTNPKITIARSDREKDKEDGT